MIGHYITVLLHTRQKSLHKRARNNVMGAALNLLTMCSQSGLGFKILHLQQLIDPKSYWPTVAGGSESWALSCEPGSCGSQLQWLYCSLWSYIVGDPNSSSHDCLVTGEWCAEELVTLPEAREGWCVSEGDCLLPTAHFNQELTFTFPTEIV